MKERIKQLLCFRPRLLPCGVGSLLTILATLYLLFTGHAETLPPLALYALYAAAFVFLCLTVWAAACFICSGSPVKQLSDKLHRHTVTARLVDDAAYRIHLTGYASLGLNGLMALSKGVIGWWTGSTWQIVLSVYYVMLCGARYGVLEASRRTATIADGALREKQEWRLYRLCGLMLIVLMAVLQGVVIKIVRDDDAFTYDGMLIYVAALYDFCRLISSIVYMVKTRKKHAATTVAIKIISFATSLVAMLSLQTAMFASFGGATSAALRQTMNLLTGTFVCIGLLGMGIAMVIHASKKLTARA